MIDMLSSLPAVQKRKPSFKKIAARIIVATTAFCATCIVLFVVWALQPRDARGATSNFTVSKGENSSVVAHRLRQEGFIRNERIFRFVVVWNGTGTAIKAGDFSLSPAMSPFEIANILTAPSPPERDVNITIPEGFTVSQIDKKLSDAKLIQLGALVHGSGSVTAYDFLPECLNRHQLQNGQDVCDIEYAALEGYLFPDTYRYKPDATRDVIVEKMLANFNAKLSIPLRADIASQNKSVKDIIIMASILEREVRSDVDKATVAGILWKRLAQNYPLQVDATVLYALEQSGKLKPKGQGLTTEDLQMESPYNTYRYKGLPPSPISNPGLASIVAAAHPEESPYFFYLTTPDGTTIFSKTLAEHNRAKARYLR